MKSYKNVLTAVVCALVWAPAAAGAGQRDRQYSGLDAARTAVSPAADTPTEAVPAVPSAVMEKDGSGHITIRAVRVTRAPSIDGVLDDEVYQLVPASSGFIQQEPKEGAPATDDANVWVLYDDNNLYISARLFQDPKAIVATEMRRDSRELTRNDNFALVLDTFLDHRSAFFFYMSAAGGMFDGLITEESQNNREWNTVWDGRTGRFEGGWTAEFSIPFRSLRYAPGRDQTWGINFRRIMIAKNELHTLAPVPASYGPAGVQRMSLAATLTGLQVPTAGRNFEIKPYALSSVTTDKLTSPAKSNDPKGNIGFDMKYGVTRGLNLDVSYNTDFAQVEDDEQQVNLTRFSLFFPERRDFFLEGQGIFTFGGVRLDGTSSGGNVPILFFGRRIGLTNGRPIPLTAGARLTGRVGAYSIGALNVETGSDENVGAVDTNFSVVRVKRDFLKRSQIGFIATNRSVALGGPDSNQTLGFDSQLAPYQQMVINTYYAKSHTSDKTGDDASYRLQFEYPADRYGLQLEHLTVEKNFNPEVGFLRRENFRRNFAEARFSPRPNRDHWKAIRKFTYQGSLEYITDTGGHLESRETQLQFQTALANSDQGTIEYTQNYEFLPEAFEISKGITLPVGGYTFDNLKAQYGFGPQRQVSGTVTVNRGTFYDGDRTSAEYSGKVQFGSRLTLEPKVSINWVDLSEGSFTTKLYSTRASVTFSPRMALGALIQYNSSAATVAANLRFHWEYQPGSDFFVVFNEGHDTLGPFARSLQNRSFTVKITRLLRL
jgi:hypothetical protein